LEGVAVNVTDVPVQIAPEGDAAIATVGVTLELTDIVIVFDRAVWLLKHVPPVIVMVQVTCAPFVSELLV